MRGPALARLWSALPAARVVGGAVRDHLAGRPVADIDLATPERPEDVQRRLTEFGIRTIPTGIEHGTVTALVDGASFEVTTLRQDVATDGRHARVAYTEDFAADAARRDFSINAMSMDRSGRLFDYFGGAEDLAAGRIRFVGDPAARLAEDYLRLLRFFRFYARYGRTPPDPATLAALTAATPGLARLSAERIWSELQRLLATPDPVPALRQMDQVRALAALLPGPLDLAHVEKLVSAGAPADPILRLAALTKADADLLATRLRLSRAEAERLALLRGPPPPADVPGIRALLSEVPRDVALGRAWLAGADASVRERLATETVPPFPLQGRDLAAQGVSPGPEMGRLLAALRSWWRQGGCHADQAALLAELARLRGC